MRTLQRICSALPTRSKHPFLQHAQQLDLHGQAHVADFVEEQRAALGQLEAPLAGGNGAGECALLVAEQFALEQVGGNGAAVDSDEGPVAARTGVVDGAGDDFLAGTGFAQHQHAGFVGGYLVNQCKYGPNGC